MKTIDIPIVRIKHLYIDKNLTTFQVAKELGCSQGLVWKRLKKNNVPRRSCVKDIPATKLYQWYILDKLSTWEIERRYGYSRSLVFSKLKGLKIPLRSSSESHIHTPRNPFNGKSTERAYILGFAVGDLRVRLCGKSEKCETISIACSSNKPAQITLIRELFSRYGHIWQGNPGRSDIVSIEAFVDLSFSFLLEKNWVRQKSVHFAPEDFVAFLAGFTDAEGSIFFSQGMAKIAWGNYDFKLLKYIKKRLLEIGVRTTNVINDHLKGYEGKDGYRRNSDYYHIRCSRKNDMLILLSRIMPFMRHADKLKRANEALENIKARGITS